MAAAVLLVIGLAVLTVAPALEAVARWLGIGAVRIERTDQPVVTGPASSTSPAAVAPTRPDGSIDVEAVAERVPFEVRLPTAEVAGEPTAASTDPSVPSGLIEVRYPGFTLVELASQPGGAPVLAKFLGPGTETTPVTVAGQPGLWITGDPHEVAFIDPDGTTRLDRVRGRGRRAAVGGRRRDLPHRGSAVARRGARRRRLPPLIPRPRREPRALERCTRGMAAERSARRPLARWWTALVVAFALAPAVVACGPDGPGEQAGAKPVPERGPRRIPSPIRAATPASPSSSPMTVSPASRSGPPPRAGWWAARWPHQTGRPCSAPETRLLATGRGSRCSASIPVPAPRSPWASP